MSFLSWFYRKTNPEEGRLQESIVRQLSEIDSRLRKLESERSSAPPLLIQHADKVVIERVDLSSHLGTLEIDSLEGQLNVGVTYHGIGKPDELFPLAQTDLPPVKPASDYATGEGKDQSPRYHIRPRPPKDRPAK